MKLDRLVLVNWGQLRPGNYEMGNLTLLTGATGVGKSTMLDGLQTVMTAAYQGIVAFNPGQDEAAQGPRRSKTKRTLESFVCGAEYSLFSRPAGAHGYIAGVFRPDPNETSGKLFTALVAVAARVDGTGDRRDARLERLVLVIVEDAALSVEEFFDDMDNGVCVPVEEIVRRLKAKYPKVTTYDDHKRDYLSGLYGRFRGRTSIPWDEAQNAARAWSQSIAYRPIGSVHDLVRDDILEFDGKALQEGISRISDLMRQVTNLKQEGKRLEATVSSLAELKQAIGKTTSTYEEQVQLDLLLAKTQLETDKERVEAELNRKDAEQASIKQFQQTAQSRELLKKSADRSRIDIEAKLRGIPAHVEKAALDELLNRATNGARAKLLDLWTGLLAAAQIANGADRLVKQPVPEEFQKLKTSLGNLAQVLASTKLDRLRDLSQRVSTARDEAELTTSTLTQLAPAFEGIEDQLTILHAPLLGASNSIITVVAAEAADVQKERESVLREQDEASKRKERLASGAGNYNRDTVNALERIRRELPDAGVQVLCDLVEPVSLEWQGAIEGYMDGSRFNLIVKPEWEARTIDFLQSWGSRSRVIQGRRCLERADEKRVPGNSIIHELRTAHPVAQAYLIEQFGAVVKVADSEQLRFTPRGLTKDGKGSGAMTMFVCERKDFVLGRRAREQALLDTNAKLAELERTLIRLEQLDTNLNFFRQVLNPMRQPKFDAMPLSQFASDIETARRGLAQLDLTEVEQLRVALESLEAEIDGHDKAITGALRNEILAKKNIEDAEASVARIEANRDSRLQEVEKQIRRLRDLCNANDEKTYIVLSQQVDEHIRKKTYDVPWIQARLVGLRAQPEALLGEVREMLAEYNGAARQDERFTAALPHLTDTSKFDAYYGPLVTLSRAVSHLHTQLEGIGLYSNRAKVEEAERSFHDVFTKQFCVEIKSKVDEGVRVLRQMNHELEKLKFGTDRFSIDWSKWEAEFQDYYGFFSAVAELADSPETIDLFGETELSPKHVEVRDRLVKLLLDPDQDRAGRELLRIADYRNYRHYEIWNFSDTGGRVALSTWGTGSGGQLETPAYIVRAAVVTNRLKLFEKGSSLKLLVNDESFSKMDESRARAVLRYLRDSLGMQIVSAMPTRNAGGLRPEFNREYSFSRVHVPENGELEFILECDERVFKNDKMRDLWERQRHEVRDQARLVFEAVEPVESVQLVDGEGAEGTQ